jgi:hypothetical protein
LRAKTTPAGGIARRESERGMAFAPPSVSEHSLNKK